MLNTNENYAFAVNELFAGCNLKENTCKEITRYFCGNSDSFRLSTELHNIKFTRESLTAFGQHIFSLIQLKAILERVINFFLSAEKYNELIEILKCCAVNSSYSANVYKSMAEEYSIEERSFDRFVEMLATTEIPVSKYIPMFLYCLDAGSNEPVKIWIRPVKEYFKRKHNYNNLVEYTNKHRSTNAYALLLEVDSEFAIDKIIDILLFSLNTQKVKYRALLLPYKRAAVKAAEPYLKDNNISVREQAVRILLLFKSDESVLLKLTQCYLDESTNRIKSLIARECGLRDEGLRFDSLSDMLDYCNEFDSQFSKKGLPALLYDTGEPVDVTVYAALTTHLADQRKPLTYAAQAKEIAKFIDAASLAKAAEEFYPQINFNSDKYKLPFCILFGSPEILEQEISRQAAILDGEEFHPRRFMTLGLRYDDKVKNFYYGILRDESKKKIHKYAFSGLELICGLNNLNIQDIEDEKVNDFGLNEKGTTRFSDGSTLTLTEKLEASASSKKGIAASMAPLLDREVRNEIRRFETAMIEGRRWSRDNFINNIIGNRLLNKIASTLFFSEYKHGRLVNIFIVEGEIRSLDNAPYMPSEKSEIMVSHPLDLYTRFDNLKFNNLFQPFKQAERECFRPVADDIARNYVDRFNSYIVDETVLLKRLKTFGWTLAEPLESGAVTHCTKAVSGIIAMMTFREPLYPQRGTAVSIGQIKFFPQNLAIKYFVPQKARPLDIAGMDKRLFSEFLYDVSRIVKG